MYISTPPSPEVENFQMKIYYPAGDRTPDLLNQRQTCYHLSQPGELTLKNVDLVIYDYDKSLDVCSAQQTRSTERPQLRLRFYCGVVGKCDTDCTLHERAVSQRCRTCVYVCVQSLL